MLFAADVYARAGEDAKARSLIDQAAKQRPDDVFVQDVNAPIVRAVLELNHHSADKALDLMKAAQPYDPANTESRYTRGSAYLMAGKGDEAAKEFQAVLNLKNGSPSDPTMSFGATGLWPARMRCLTRAKHEPRTRISLPSGKTPTLTSRS